MLKDDRVVESKFLDLSQLDSLRYIEESDGQVHIGARATFGDCIRSRVLQRTARVILDAIETIASPQIRNLGTVAGNLGNASPAGDSIPPLFVLGSKVVLENSSGKREVPIEAFFIGYRKTVRRNDELIREVCFPPVSKNDITFFKKLGLRHANAISVASVAFWAKPKGDRIAHARIALGAVAPTVIRATKSEANLTGAQLTTEKAKNIAKMCADESRPISDIRGSASYRRRAIEALTYMGLVEVAERFHLKQA